MPGQRRHTRIDTIVLKHRIETRIGPVKSDKYFSVLSNYFSHRIHKAEFDRLCIRLLGRNNISLHNDLIRAILKNASTSNVPPPAPCNNSRKIQNVEVENGYRQSSLQLLCRNVFPQSPTKMRTEDHEYEDRPSPLGPLGKNPQNAELQDLVPEIPLEVASSGNEDFEQCEGSFLVDNGSPIKAPFGVCLNGREIRTLPTSLSSDTCYKNGELPDTSTLSRKLEQNLRTNQNLSITEDCAKVLNSGLDMFIKRLLRPCLDLAASRSENRVHMEVNNQISTLPNGRKMLECVQKSGNKRSFHVSIGDFRVAMESNPTILGQDWPLQLEKISSYEEEHDSKGRSR